MDLMTSSRLRRWALVGALTLTGGSFAFLPGRPVNAAAATAQDQVATVQQLKTDAFKALRSGKFDVTNELLSRAATLSKDPADQKMASWTGSFESQRKEFAAERQKSYEKAVKDVHMLIDRGKGDYAVDVASRAYLLSADKTAFRHEKWVDDLINNASRKAENYEKNEQWIKALRLYSDLGSVEPEKPLWKDRLKLTTRRVRLLALYTPDVLKSLQEGESKDRDEVDALLNPTTQPSTKPAKEKDDAANDAFRINWKETLNGVQMDMLWQALLDARNNYYRDVSYKGLALGGLDGIRAIVTTKGLEKAFPKLGDETARKSFLDQIEKCASDAKEASGPTEQFALRTVLAKLRTSNKATVEIPEEVIVSEFADGAFAELDPFTSMIWPSDLEEFNKTTQGEFSGVGIQIQSDEDGSLKVATPLEDSPAYKAGIKSGDIITHIDGRNAKGITLNQAVKTITGPKGSRVTLTVRSPDAKVKDYNIRRDTIKVASVKGWLHLPGGGWDFFVDSENKIGYMRMTNFTKDTAEELDRALADMSKRGAKAVVLDLRYNPGGLLTAATDVSDKFLSGGTIVSTHPDRETGNAPTIATAKPDEDDSKLPLVVLVNQYSASASEIVSGCLKDHKRALIVGERTFGKGSVQMLFPLTDRTAYLKLTTSHYYLPLGRCIHREENSTEWGVDPDVAVEMTPEQMRAAIDARQEQEILRDAQAAPAEGKQEKLNDIAPQVREKTADATVGGAPEKNAEKKPKKDLLAADPQLSAAVLLLKLQLAGAEL
jgi:carboxyl-terminal processing protease